MKHLIVYEREATFAGWPANNGLWSWDGQEILAGFTIGDFAEQPGHNLNPPYRSLLARSRDQGETWTTFEPESYVGSVLHARELDEAIDFTNPGFAMRLAGTGYHGTDRPSGAFFFSYDRGSAWLGAFSFGSLNAYPELLGLEITSRTDYLVTGRRECLLFMSARGGSLTMDRTFCARTTDGGLTFQFLSWIVPPSDPYRGVMPSTVRGASGGLVSAIRRREPHAERCWIDAYASADDGHSWSLAGKVADTGGWNGNPPALARLGDGRLCCVYGERNTCRIIARYSADEGRTWGGEIVLRDDFLPDRFGDPDMGYPRLVQRLDGFLVALYYWATRDILHQHIAATIWHPAGET